jgi:hypothetical protein
MNGIGRAPTFQFLERLATVGAGSQIVDVSLGDQFSVSDDPNVCGQSLDDLENVRGQKDRSAARHKRQQQILDLPRCDRVDPFEGLVLDDEHRWILAPRPGLGLTRRAS